MAHPSSPDPDVDTLLASIGRTTLRAVGPFVLMVNAIIVSQVTFLVAAMLLTRLPIVEFLSPWPWERLVSSDGEDCRARVLARDGDDLIVALDPTVGGLVRVQEDHLDRQFDARASTLRACLPSDLLDVRTTATTPRQRTGGASS